MKNQFTISSAYDWGKNDSRKNNSEAAIKKITEIIKKRFSSNKNQKFNYPINYRKLRASAGKTILGSIIKRIEESNVVIIDITKENMNVFIEAGIAIALSNTNKHLSVYFIREKNPNFLLPNGLPSDLQGYFISEYIVDKRGTIVFKDDNSLRMSIEGDVKSYFNDLESNFSSIDEILMD